MDPNEESESDYTGYTPEQIQEIQNEFDDAALFPPSEEDLEEASQFLNEGPEEDIRGMKYYDLENKYYNTKGQLSDARATLRQQGKELKRLRAKTSDQERRLREYASMGTVHRDKDGKSRMVLDRLLPNNLEIEMALLGNFIRNPQLMDAVSQPYIHLMLYQHAHKVVHKVLMDLGSRVNFETLESEIRRRGELDEIGGPIYLANLAKAGTPVDKDKVKEYMEILEDRYLGRQVIEAGSNIVAQAYENCYEKGSLSFVDFIRQHSLNLLTLLPKRFQFNEDMRAPVDSVEANFAETVKRKGKPALSTGYKGLDRVTHGMIQNRLVVIGARPKIGKSTFYLNVADNIARQGHHAAIFTTESSLEELTQKLISRRAGFDCEKFIYYDDESAPTDQELIRVNKAMEEVRDLPIIINPRRKLEMEEIVNRCRQLKSRFPNLALVVLDGMQSFAGYVEYHGNKSDVYYDVLKRAKADLAGELGLTVLLTTQLKTRVEGKKPKSVDDFSDCKGLSEVPDTILALYRPEFYWPDKPEYAGWMSVIPIARRVGKSAGREFRLDCDMATANIYELPETETKKQLALI